MELILIFKLLFPQEFMVNKMNFLNKADTNFYFIFVRLLVDRQCWPGKGRKPGRLLRKHSSLSRINFSFLIDCRSALRSPHFKLIFHNFFWARYAMFLRSLLFPCLLIDKMALPNSAKISIRSVPVMFFR